MEDDVRQYLTVKFCAVGNGIGRWEHGALWAFLDAVSGLIWRWEYGTQQTEHRTM